jgi:hypothetical protein
MKIPQAVQIKREAYLLNKGFKKTQPNTWVNENENCLVVLEAGKVEVSSCYRWTMRGHLKAISQIVD